MAGQRPNAVPAGIDATGATPLYVEPVSKGIELALLCDAASLRNDLLSVLGAGITTLTVGALPALAELTLVAQAAFTEPDIGSQETLAVDASSEGGESLASLTFSLRPERPAEADLAIPYVFTLIQPLAIPLARTGLYAVTVTLQGVTTKRLPLRVRA